MNPADLADMLDTMARALRVLPVGAGPAMPAQQKHTLGEWLDVHEQTLRRHGYKAQTLRNRHATIGHLRRLWGGRDIAPIKPREVDCALLAGQRTAYDRGTNGNA